MGGASGQLRSLRGSPGGSGGGGGAMDGHARPSGSHHRGAWGPRTSSRALPPLCFLLSLWLVTPGVRAAGYQASWGPGTEMPPGLAGGRPRAGVRGITGPPGVSAGIRLGRGVLSIATVLTTSLAGTLQAPRSLPWLAPSRQSQAEFSGTSATTTLLSPRDTHPQTGLS